MWKLCTKNAVALAEILFVAMFIIPGHTLANEENAQVMEINDAAQVLNAPKDGIYFQHVQIQAPKGTCVAAAVDGAFMNPAAAPQYFALQVGTQYRFRVTDVPLMPGIEVFPTIEILDRTHPPIGEELRHAVIIELTKEDLYAAIRGKFVTRVIYIENPDTAFPISSKDQVGQGYFDIAPESDPIAVAKTLGRPIAILRIGGRAPGQDEGYDMAFLNNCPPFLHYPPQDKAAE
ncbi:MAG: hypothetical protein E7028_03780 [Planctomycetaceae bacterium]|nr:hypothetical protein [Planctomycetaceae bacterium]MBQ2820352.1 hypothetical protein [Thermoguttaceae bacterium]MDO4425489.1 hypothetical protein [Planctomycetia bacterium]